VICRRFARIGHLGVRKDGKMVFEDFGRKDVVLIREITILAISWQKEASPQFLIE
jgi:hypothetical protein